MTPSIDERLGSVIRSLSEVILPHLPADAPLAQEQAQLAIGHLQILRAQIDAAPDFEREELDDYLNLARLLTQQSCVREAHPAQVVSIEDAVGNSEGLGVREQRVTVNRAVEALISAAMGASDTACSETVRTLVLDHAAARSLKDRKWFAAFGFDTL